MRYKYFLILFILLILTSNIYSLNYITTAESISWSGAYTSVGHGFEAMLYNPAGIYMTPYKFGINIFGSYGARIYNNSMSTDSILKIIQAMEQGQNLTSTGIIADLLFYMPETGVDFGADISFFNLMTYSKMKEFSFGIAVIPKTSVTFTASKGLFSTIFQQLDLSTEVKYSTQSTILQYLDLSFMLSTRAKFIEEVVPIEKIFVGITGHFYLPTVYMKSDSSVRLTSGPPNAVGVIDNYQIRVKGTVSGSSNYVANILFKLLADQLYSTGSSSGEGGLENIASMLMQNIDVFRNYGGGFAFGIGCDLGFILEFNRFVKIGFAMTDIGFIVFPRSALIALDYTVDLSLTGIDSLRDDLINEYINAIEDKDNFGDGQTLWYMPDTAIRFGIAVTPFKKDIFKWASDISLSDLNRMINGGYPTFNFATGIEFKPGYKWFAMPMRIAFSYNSQANTPSFSFGLGLYLGPVEMEFAVKGLELLISELGAKEFTAGVDLKFEF